VIKSKRTRWAYMEERRNAYEILTGKSKCRKPVGRISHTFKDNIEMDFREKHCEDVNSNNVPYDRFHW
jgi:hypothetical protein